MILFCLLQSPIFAQFKYKVDRKHVNFSAGYFSMIDLSSDIKKFNHGAEISVAYSIINKSREKLQRKTKYNRIVDRDIYIKMNVSTYQRKRLYNTLGVSVGPAFRITIPEGMFFEFDGQLGYLRTFLKGDFYNYNGDEITGARLLGNNLLSIQGNGIIGWNFQKSNDYPAALFLGVGMLSYFSNNGKWLFQPQFRFGASFVLVRYKDTYVE